MIDELAVLSNYDELNDPIFVVGCARSGTGALARTIGLAESVCYLGETKIIPKYYTTHVPITLAISHWQNGEALLPVLKGKAKRIRDFIKAKDPLRDIVTNVVRYTKLTNYDLKPSVPLIDRYGVRLTEEDATLIDKLYNKYKKLCTKGIDRTLRIMFKDFQILSKKNIILEKTPLHVLYLRTIQRIFPEAKICHIYREGRNVAASYVLNYGEKKFDNNSIRYICNMYKNAMRINSYYIESKNEKYYSIKYEEFLCSPIDTINDIFIFLKIPLSEQVLYALEDVKPMVSNWSKLPLDIQKRIEYCLELAK